MASPLSKDQIDFFNRNGYLILQKPFTRSDIQNLQNWAQEVHDWKATAESKFMPYEVQVFHRNE
jgi:2-aminoethylphosphonate dioxygenase